MAEIQKNGLTKIDMDAAFDIALEAVEAGEAELLAAELTVGLEPKAADAARATQTLVAGGSHEFGGDLPNFDPNALPAATHEG